MPLASGHTYRKLEGEEFDRIAKRYVPSKLGLVRLSPGEWVFPLDYVNFADKLYNFEVKPSDVYVVTFMKVGTTWTQEIVWTMMYNPNLDHPDQNDPILERSIFLDADMLFPKDMTPEMATAFAPFIRKFQERCPGADPKEGVQIQLAAASQEPRIIKSHLPMSLNPPDMLKKAKVVYVVRDPRDVVCSYYHHCQLFKEMKFNGTVDDFAEFFMKEDAIYSPYWLHVKEAWEKRDHPNMHIMLYEDMKKDIMKELKKLDAFLGTHLTEQQLENVKKHTSFSEMKSRDNIMAKTEGKSLIMDEEVLKKEGGFFKQGKSGEGKRKLKPETLKKLDKWTKEHFDFGLNYN